MPIGATIGAAVVGAGAGIISSSNASSATQHAADQASATEQNVANQNNQLARDMYAKNEGHLTPFMNAGMAAGDEYLGLLLGPEASHKSLGWYPVAGTAPTTTTPTTGATGTTAPATTPWSSMTHISPANALSPLLGSQSAPAASALGGIVAQHAADAIAAGANPAAVAQRAAQYGVTV